jgi:hypothetical protein
MRVTVSLLCLVAMLCLAQPAEAQLRETALNGPSPTQLYDTSRNFLSKLFGAEHFNMSHTYEMSMTSFGNESASMGMYTNTMMWQFNSAWAARVDVGVMQPFSGNMYGDQSPRVILRNAEVAYRPSENTEIRFQVQQSPYGRYASPYGAYRPYGHRSAFASPHSSSIYWRTN